MLETAGHVVVVHSTSNLESLYAQIGVEEVRMYPFHKATHLTRHALDGCSARLTKALQLSVDRFAASQRHCPQLARLERPAFSGSSSNANRSDCVRRPTPPARAHPRL